MCKTENKKANKVAGRIKHLILSEVQTVLEMFDLDIPIKGSNTLGLLTKKISACSEEQYRELYYSTGKIYGLVTGADIAWSDIGLSDKERKIVDIITSI